MRGQNEVPGLKSVGGLLILVCEDPCLVHQSTSLARV